MAPARAHARALCATALLVVSLVLLSKSGFHDYSFQSTLDYLTRKRVFESREAEAIIRNVLNTSLPELGHFDENIFQLFRQKKRVEDLFRSKPMNNFNISYKISQQHRCLNFTTMVVFITPSHVFNFERREKMRNCHTARYVQIHKQTAMQLFFVGMPDNGIPSEKRKWG